MQRCCYFLCSSAGNVSLATVKLDKIPSDSNPEMGAGGFIGEKASVQKLLACGFVSSLCECH